MMKFVKEANTASNIYFSLCIDPSCPDTITEENCQSGDRITSICISWGPAPDTTTIPPQPTFDYYLVTYTGSDGK